MRQLRTDRETYPAAVSVQVLRRKPTDQYGNEQAGRGRNQERKRALQTRNGMPVRLYGYRGTGESMSEKEAQFWLERGQKCSVMATVSGAGMSVNARSGVGS